MWLSKLEREERLNKLRKSVDDFTCFSLVDPAKSEDLGCILEGYSAGSTEWTCAIPKRSQGNG